MNNLLLLIDGNSLMYRAFFALPIMNNESGVYTNAIYGFLSMMLKIMEEEKPTHVAVAFDVHGKTFRNDKYEEYKAGRKPTPDELRPQFIELQKVLKAMDIITIGIQGYEADDIIGTLSEEAHRNNMMTKIITGDKDAFQLIKDDVYVLLTRKGITDIDVYDKGKLFEKYTLPPNKMIDLKGLMGDTSDNIPGIPSVGEKTAIKLLTEYSDLESVLDNADEIKGKLGEKIRENKKLAILSKELAKIDVDVPMDVKIEDCKLKAVESRKVIPILQKLQLNTIIKKISKMYGEEQHYEYTEPEIIEIENLDSVKSLMDNLLDKAIISFVIDENVCLSDGEKEYKIPIIHNLLDNGFDLYNILKALKPFFESETPKAVYDAKNLMHLLAKLNINIRGVDFDAFLAGIVLGRGAQGGLFGLAERTLGFCSSKAPAYMLFLLAREQKKIISDRKQNKVFDEIEMKLTPVLFDMETVGFKINTDVLNALDKEFSSQLDMLTQKIYESAGKEFNINSPKQLGEVLFEDLGLPSGKKTKTGWSTDIRVLEMLREDHAIIDPIIKYRGLAKLKGTYIDGLIPLVTKEGRLHTQLNQIGAITGRLSSSSPNLQNIPVRTDNGAQLRKSFIASDENHILIDADYSQIELRVLAHISGDENLIEAFKTGADIHKRTASQVLGIPFDEVTSSMRSSAKAVNFGIVYGISDFGLARQLDISIKKAGEFIDRYFEAFPKIKEFMQKCIDIAREKGYAETMFGRRIYLPQLRSSNYNQRTSAERVAMNAPIQGSAADIIKLAMIAVYKEIINKGYKSKLILQVHDELIIDVLKSESEQLEKMIKKQMEQVVELECDLLVDVSMAENWFDAK